MEFQIQRTFPAKQAVQMCEIAMIKQHADLARKLLKTYRRVIEEF